jgi:pSer/pThr/pTyr-binding forkhead associated (FHA) protein
VITVGRSRDADITLTYPGISKEHARFRLRPGADEPIVTLEDAGSRNGTFVDDGPLPSDQPIRLSDRSRIRFAGYLFRFHTAEGFAEVVELLARRDSMPSPAG